MSKTLTYPVLGFPVYQLRHEEAFGFYQFVDSLIGSQSTALGLAKTKPAFTAALKAFDQALKPAIDSALTKVIAGDDHNRDQCYLALKDGVSAQRRTVDTDTRHEKALYLKAILDRYKTKKHLNYIEETGVLTNLLQDLAEPTAAAYIEQLSLTVLVKALREAQEKFMQAYKKRLDEELDKIRANITVLRQQVDITLAEVILVIRAGAADQKKVCIDFLLEYDALVIKNKALITSHKGTGPKRKPKPETPEPAKKRHRPSPASGANVPLPLRK